MKTFWITIEQWTSLRTLSTMEIDPEDIEIYTTLEVATKAWKDKKEWRASKPFSDVDDLFRRERNGKDRITKSYLYTLDDESYIIKTNFLRMEVSND